MHAVKQFGQESPVWGHNCEFSPLFFSKFRLSGMLQPHKGYVVVKVSTENNVFCFSKRIISGTGTQ